jgi:hypothetical protein
MFTLNVNQGEQNALNYILEETQIPIPEFAAIPITTLTVGVAATLFLERRKRR